MYCNNSSRVNKKQIYYIIIQTKCFYLFLANIVAINANTSYYYFGLPNILEFV